MKLASTPRLLGPARLRRGVAAVGACAVVGLGLLLIPGASTATASVVPDVAAPVVPPSLLDSLRGRSRKLRARFVSPARPGSIAILRRLFGEDADARVGVHTAQPEATAAVSSAFHFITMRPFSDKVQGRIGTYRIGFFPNEHATGAPQLVKPDGFVEVTLDNQDTPVSDHFRLRDFLTHDQGSVWPKYLVLREPLVDKLELVIDELRAMGVAVGGMRVMSGFRTPQYNALGVNGGGRVKDSRHQFGDAADVYVVNGSGDRMSDLNRDGRVDTRDAKVLAMAAERVEREHPDLVGGIGIYPATNAHGPFVHIDVRGRAARWGGM